jgi:hypothetical protein
MGSTPGLGRLKDLAIAAMIIFISVQGRLIRDLLDRHKSWPNHTPGHRELLGMIRTGIERVRRMLVAGDPTETVYFSDVLLH